MQRQWGGELYVTNYQLPVILAHCACMAHALVSLAIQNEQRAKDRAGYSSISGVVIAEQQPPATIRALS
jgi:hypothetical protein